MAAKDHYAALNIPQNASEKEIKTAYRQLALKYHPDHNPGDKQAESRFLAIREAYDLLSDLKTRTAYDLNYRPSPRPATAEPQATKPSKGKPTSSSSVKKGGNLRYNLYISLEEVLSGGERSIRYLRTNKGVKETLQVSVQIPKGAFHHQRLKVVGFGDTDGSSAGDLFVILHLHEHPIFLKNDINLRVNVPVTYLDLVLGSTIEIPTLTGIKKLKLKPESFDQLEYVFKGHGLPDPKNRYKGDLLIHCFIEHPKALNSQQRAQLQKLAGTWPHGEMMQQYQSYIQTKRGN